MTKAEYNALLDKFAAAALTGEFAAQTSEHFVKTYETMNEVAHKCFQQAAAMLEVREEYRDVSIE